jgi:hypothetical protein
MIDLEKLYPIVNDWDWVTHFEKTIAKYCGSHYALAVDSNTNAIKLLLEYLEIKNQTIFIPKNTYVSVPSQIIHSGNIPHFIDLEWEGEYQLFPYPIWDSATRFKKDMHTLKTYQILSFHLKKILNIGTGGMILTEDREFLEWARPKIYDGRDFTKMYVDDDFQCIGYHMYMTPEQAKRGLEIFHSERIIDDNTDCGSSKTYKDLSKQKIFEKYVNVPKKYKGLAALFEKPELNTNRYVSELPYIKKKDIENINDDDLNNWIIVVKNHEDHKIFNDFDMDEVLNLSEKTIQIIKRNPNVFFILSDYREGNYEVSDKFWQSIIDFRNKHNISCEKIIVVNNNIKLYHKEVTTIPIPTYLVSHRMNASITDLHNNKHADKNISIVSKKDLDRNILRSKKFLSYNRCGHRWHRVFMLSKLYKMGILDNTVFSYYENQYFNDKKIFGDLKHLPNKFETLDISLKDKFDIVKFLVDKCPTLLDHQTAESASGGHNYFSKKEHYLDTYISIVNEKGINDNCTFITEKTVRPMFNRHPFIVWGNPHILKTLRSYGFKTFDWLVDESYDECEDANERFKLILKELDILNKMSIDELHELYYDNIDVMEHNYQRLLEMGEEFRLDDFLTKKFF